MKPEGKLPWELPTGFNASCIRFMSFIFRMACSPISFQMTNYTGCSI